LHDRFGRDQHEALIRQLFHIRQVGSVTEYVDQFSTLIDQLVAYEPNTNPLHYATRFVDGLRDDIKSVVMIQRPSTLDTACSLALVQEEAVESGWKREFRCSEPFSHMTVQKPPLSSPAPLKPDKTTRLTMSEDRRQIEAARAGSMDDKMRALQQYRRAKGLCEKCAEKWTHGHKCAATIQLHVIQELWEMFPDDETHSTLSDDSDSVDSSEYGHICAFLSEAAVSGKQSSKSMQLMGTIQGHSVFILVDSGSSHSFVSQSVATWLQGITSLSSTMTVQIANGTRVVCDTQLASAQWQVQGCEFSTNLKIIHLSHYDMIIGYDWLEEFSPMRLHWKDKWKAIPYQNAAVVIHGISSLDPQVPEAQVCQLSEDLHLDVDDTQAIDEHNLPEIQHLLSVYNEVFASKVCFPPYRAYSHSIPLIPGSRPVCARSYRYAPILKNEIERQVQDMLDNGLMQPSNSPFSSPVLLVKKKDQSYRFCIDYRYLNAITAKGQFPVPVIDEFLDELQQASWFSTLDLCSGFHQIPMNPEDSYKIAFQTHISHYEF
jgi:hypothetical protein